MEKYYLLCFMVWTFIFSYICVYDFRGGRIFEDKCFLKEKSLFRKILLTKKNRDYPLEVFRVVPWAINAVLFMIVLIIYILYFSLYTFPIGILIGKFLQGDFAQYFGLIWMILTGLYFATIRVI